MLENDNIKNLTLSVKLLKNDNGPWSVWIGNEFLLKSTQANLCLIPAPKRPINNTNWAQKLKDKGVSITDIQGNVLNTKSFSDEQNFKFWSKYTTYCLAGCLTSPCSICMISTGAVVSLTCFPVCCPLTTFYEYQQKESYFKCLRNVIFSSCSFGAYNTYKYYKDSCFTPLQKTLIGPINNWHNKEQPLPKRQEMI